ncbi:TonB-dependent receptor [Edaphobacter paludis]|uniref:TonB-dependent receptor n=1 Tax=Edaphobacter paludis TaxID=3035702 RepID=A0AAU7D0X4_9BACT
MRRLIRWTMLGLGMLPGIGLSALAQTAGAPAADPAPAAITVQAASGGTIKGTVKAGVVPLPGVAVTAANTLTGKKYATTTDIAGSFEMVIPRNGRYVVKAELAAFAVETKEVLLEGGKPEQVATFAMQLASRVARAEAQQAGTAGSGLGQGQGTQALSVTGDNNLSDASAGTGNAEVQMPTLSGLGSGDQATDSVAVSGQVGQTNGLANFNEDEIRQRVEDAVARARAQGGAAGDMANAVVGMLGGMMGGPGGGGGGGGRGGGGRGGGGGGGFRGFNPTQPHGAIFYQGGNGALNAAPFSVAQALGEPGAQVVKPSSMSNRFGVSFVGSPFIPGLVKASTKQFVFFNVTGQRNINPEIFNGTVPTLAERNGDFSALRQTLYDPATKQPIPGNNLKNAVTPISPQALALLNYYPAPNVPNASERNNYQTVTNAGQNSTSAALRYVRNFGQGGFAMMRRPAANAPKTLRQNINFNGSYAHSASDSRNIFLPLGGTTASEGYGVTAGYTIGYGKLTNNASINWNRSHATTQNYFTNGAVNPGAQAGVLVGNSTIQSNQFYYGVPTLSFGGSNAFTGLSNTAPNNSINQTISFSDFVSYRLKKHNMRYGVDIRRVHADTIGGTQVTPLGSFSFTGYATQNPASDCTASASVTCPVVPASGSGFADFLLGMPQQASVQAGLSKTYLRANVFDWYAQDDWRVLANLTLNFGLRYEYFSPYVEKNNHLVNLDHNANFTAVEAVQPDQKGTYSGSFPRSLVNPDRSMYSPRFGFAYRPKLKFLKETVVRGGYGINYNTGQYGTIAKQLANQQPFAVTQTNIAGQQGCGTFGQFTLAGAFNCSKAPVQNNFSANRDYRLGHVQIWDLDIQRTLPLGIVANVGYDGSKGGNLDMVRAPNRTATGLLIPGAQAFNYEDSLGYSRFEALRVNVRKRLQKGVSLQATYQYGHSIDNASSIGGGSQTVAQNDNDLNAEEGNSAFDVRHKLTGNWVFELPFGPNRMFFTKGGVWSKVTDGFSLSGDFTFASGPYYTPNYQLTVQETATGSNNSLRPNRNFGAPISGERRIGDWFNAAAFTAPAAGEFGTASRNSIEGPGTMVVDASLSRTIPLGETRSFEARVTAANALNIVQYSGIDTTLNSPTFGQVRGAAPMRSLTVFARYRF